DAGIAIVLSAEAVSTTVASDLTELSRTGHSNVGQSNERSAEYDSELIRADVVVRAEAGKSVGSALLADNAADLVSGATQIGQIAGIRRFFVLDWHRWPNNQVGNRANSSGRGSVNCEVLAAGFRPSGRVAADVPRTGS